MGFDWANLIEVANATVAAAARDKNAALEILRCSAGALRGLLGHDIPPDPEQKVYLQALLDALDAIENGADPATALNLTQGHRVRDETLFARGFAVFIDIGREIDRLEARGHTRGDKPVQAAQRTVAKQWGLSVETVKKAWYSHGGGDGWTQLRSVVNGMPDEK